ncbi:MAG TPA: glycine zipper 2TM domain-containing protein [Chitinophagaceae bacterium]|nr:glycine zipper 2TM domain-containing protein [Chitinophagaceae bacterium]
MKKTLLIVTIATGMIACNTQPKQEDLTKSVSYEDTVGFASFQNWKAQNERKDPSQYYMTGNELAASQAPPKTTVVHKTVYVPAANSSNSVATVPAKKKGWSKAAKGTAIGTTAGAVAGAIISKKNRVLGGVIGGVLGGVGGYAIGRGMDKKDGRVN